MNLFQDMGIDKVVNFPFPTCPEEEALKVWSNFLYRKLQ